MASPQIRPLAEPREFSLDELFFSTTDLKGRIVYGNAVFTRISGYEESELRGAPHSVIRHPDMPRWVFKLLWDYLEAGRTVAAYVKNMAKDGRCYWVLAVVTPCRDGYLSIRLKPTSPLLAIVQDLYRELLAVEDAAEANGSNRKGAMTASAERLAQRLRSKGFAQYDDFMREALSFELRTRHSGLQDAGYVASTDARGRLGAMAVECRRIGDLLHSLFESLDLFKKLNRELSEKSSQLFDVAETLHFESLNAKIAAGKLEQGAAVLGAISRELSASSRDTEELIGRFIELTRPINQLIGDVIFDVATARLEAEVCQSFAVELFHSSSDDDGALLDSAMETLAAEMAQRGAQVDRNLHRLVATMGGLGGAAAAIMAKVVEMKAVQFAGNKESLSRRDAGGFVNIFTAVGDRIARGKEDCAELIATIAACQKSASAFIDDAPEIRRLLGDVHDAAKALHLTATAAAC